jgi:RNA polymerase sigma factor (sigma-70 family)
MPDGSVLSRRDVKRLVAQGTKQGYLTEEEIFSVVTPEAVEDLDELLDHLKRSAVILAESPEDGARQARIKRSETQALAQAAGDAMSSYLREIAHLGSLDRETEIRHAREFRAGMKTAMRAVVDAQLFVDQMLKAASRIRQERQPLWDVVDRLRSVDEDEESDAPRTEFLEQAKRIAGLRNQEKRLLSKLSRRGLHPETHQTVAHELRTVRSEITDLLLAIPFEQRFMQEIATRMIQLHDRLEKASKLADHLLLQVGAESGSSFDAALRSARSSTTDPEALSRLDLVDRRHKKLHREILRIEGEVGVPARDLHRIVRAYRSGRLTAQRARDALILSAQRLVLSSARFYGRRLGGSGMEVADLISAGNLGLIRAVELFDPDRGYRFSTFAGHWVRHAMIRTIHTQSRTVYVPPHIRQQMSKILAVENELIQKHGRLPSDEEIAGASEIELGKVRHTQQSFGRMSSIDRPIDPDDSGSATYGDILADDGLKPDENLEESERRSLIRELAERLEGRERTIVFMRMGWEDHDAMTLAEIGDAFKISRQRVEQLEKRALTKLRRWAKASGLGDPFQEE